MDVSAYWNTVNGIVFLGVLEVKQVSGKCH